MSLLLDYSNNSLSTNGVYDNYSVDIQEELPCGKLDIELMKNNDKCIVTDIYINSAVKNKIKKNDILYKLNDICLDDLSIEKIAKIFNYSSNSKRIIEIKRQMYTF